MLLVGRAVAVVVEAVARVRRAGVHRRVVGRAIEPVGRAVGVAIVVAGIAHAVGVVVGLIGVEDLGAVVGVGRQAVAVGRRAHAPHGADRRFRRGQRRPHDEVDLPRRRGRRAGVGAGGPQRLGQARGAEGRRPVAHAGRLLVEGHQGQGLLRARQAPTVAKGVTGDLGLGVGGEVGQRGPGPQQPRGAIEHEVVARDHEPGADGNGRRPPHAAGGQRVGQGGRQPPAGHVDGQGRPPDERVGGPEARRCRTSRPQGPPIPRGAAAGADVEQGEGLAGGGQRPGRDRPGGGQRRAGGPGRGEGTGRQGRLAPGQPGEGVGEAAVDGREGPRRLGRHPAVAAVVQAEAQAGGAGLQAHRRAQPRRPVGGAHLVDGAVGRCEAAAVARHGFAPQPRGAGVGGARIAVVARQPGYGQALQVGAGGARDARIVEGTGTAGRERGDLAGARRRAPGHLLAGAWGQLGVLLGQARLGRATGLALHLRDLERRLGLDDLDSRLGLDDLDSRLGLDDLDGGLGLDDLDSGLGLDGLEGRLDLDDLGGRLDRDDLGPRFDLERLRGVGRLRRGLVEPDVNRHLASRVAPRVGRSAHVGGPRRPRAGRHQPPQAQHEPRPEDPHQRPPTCPPTSRQHRKPLAEMLWYRPSQRCSTSESPQL